MKVLLFANTDWYLYNFRLALALTLRDANHEVILLSPDGPYGEKLRKMGFRWIPAPMNRRSLNPWREIAFVFWLRRLLIQERVELIHNFTIKNVVYGSIAARLSGICSTVNSVAGMGYVFTSTNFKALLLRPLVRTLLRMAFGGPAVKLILQNPDDVRLFADAKLIEQKNVRMILGSGVNCQRFHPNCVAVNSDRVRFLLPARLLWDKGVSEYADAARELAKTGRNVEFLIAGEPDTGNPAAVPKSTVKKWVNEGWLDWLGHVDDMPSLFRSVDVVVLPSYREGLPKGLIEAGACGLALITTDVPGCREVVTHEENGLLVPVKNSQALAEAMSRLCDDPALRQRLGTAARKKVLEVFDERIVNRKTLAVYAEVAQ